MTAFQGKGKQSPADSRQWEECHRAGGDSGRRGGSPKLEILRDLEFSDTRLPEDLWGIVDVLYNLYYKASA